MDRVFAIGRLKDGRWTVENLKQIELTEQDMRAITSVVKNWLTMRIALGK